MLKSIKQRKRTILIALICFFLCIVIRPMSLFLWHIYLAPDMHDAIKGGDVNEVKNLLRRGANPNQHGMGGLAGGTPLDFAMEKSDLKMMKLLIDAGADVNEEDNGYFPLNSAWNPEMAKLLLDRGANPRLLNAKGLTAWQNAKYGGADEVAKIIMEYENRAKRAS